MWIAGWVATALAVAVFGVGRPAPAAGTGKVLLVLVDVSESVPHLDTYVRSCSLVVASAEPGDELILSAISSDTFESTHLLVTCRMRTPPAPTAVERDNPIDAKHYRDRCERIKAEDRSQCWENIQDAFAATSRSPNTDILNAFLLAEETFDQYPGRSHVLVLLSDMLQDAEGVRFEPRTMSASDRERLLDRLEAEKRIPNLKGVRVYVAGVGKRADVRQFWKEFLRRAKTGKPRYVPRLLQFP